MRTPSTFLALAILALALLALSAGCGAVGEQTGPNGDASGERLLVFATDRPGTAGGFDVWLYDLDAAGFRALPGLDDQHGRAFTQDHAAPVLREGSA